MTSYLVFEPPGGIRTSDDVDRVEFVSERFSWMAFLFAPVWLVWHGLWLGLAGWFGAILVLSLVFVWLGIDLELMSYAAMLPSALLAFEASEIRRRKLLRLGYREGAAVVASGVEDAELHFFAGHREAAPVVRTPAPGNFAPLAQNSVIGLFPEPGAGR